MANDPYYVVRGGLNPGVYRNWPDAVNAGWYQRQPYGNAVKCENAEQAESFLARRRKSDTRSFALYLHITRATPHTSHHTRDTTQRSHRGQRAR